MSQEFDHHPIKPDDCWTYCANTPHHHTNRTEDECKNHLTDILKQLIAGIIAGGIAKIFFKGKLS